MVAVLLRLPSWNRAIESHVRDKQSLHVSKGTKLSSIKDTLHVTIYQLQRRIEGHQHSNPQLILDVTLHKA